MVIKMIKLLHSKKTKQIGTTIVAASMALCMTACGGSTGTTTETQAVDEIVEAQTTNDGTTAPEKGDKAKDHGAFNKEGGYSGKITAIDSNTITVSVMNGRAGGGRPDGEKPDGEMPTGEMPDGEKPDGKMPTGEMPNGEKPNSEMPTGEMPDGAASETMTIEVTEDTVITVNGETADVSALEVGSEIMFTLDGETALTITVGMPEQETESQAS